MRQDTVAPADAHHYRVFGLTVRSALPLRGALDISPFASEADVEIAYGSVPPVESAPPGYHVLPGGTLLTIPAIARFWIVDGRRITVDPCPSASERNVRVFLLGSALGAILHQRGLVPLHANAVEVGGTAVAFMGHSGAGKSTMAAWFLDRGRPVLTDDVCVVDPRAPGGPLAHRGLIRLRLWREALERSGRTATEDDRSFDDQDKFDVAMPGIGLAPATLPLGAVVLLRQADRFAVERLRGMQAVDALMANIYRGGYVGLAGGSGALLQACAALAASVPVLAVARVWGFDRMEDQAARIENAVTEALRPPPSCVAAG